MNQILFQNFLTDFQEFCAKLDHFSVLPLNIPINTLDEISTECELNELFSESGIFHHSPISNPPLKEEPCEISIEYEKKSSRAQKMKRFDNLCEKNLKAPKVEKICPKVKNSKIKKGFAEEDDAKLVKEIKLHGLKWRLIARSFKGRDPTNLKNRYYYLLRKQPESFAQMFDSNLE